jgi:trans-aconitate methyltransferase
LKEFGCKLTAVDASPEMIAAARSLGLHARVINGQSLKFHEEFDAVFSNAALHWMKSPQKVLNGVWRALKPGGRFVAEFGGYGNVTTIVTSIETALTSRRGTSVAGPWYFPKKEEYKFLLEKTGFKVDCIELIPRPTKLPGDVGGWLRTFAQSYTSALPVTERQEFIAEIVETLRPKLCDEHGNWTADYVRLRFSATKPKTIIK